MGGYQDLKRNSADAAKTKTKPGSSPKNNPKPNPLFAQRFDTAYANLGAAAVLHAQHWFDKGAASLDTKHPIEWQTIASNVAPSLAHVANAGPQFRAGAYELHRAMEIYLERMTPRVPKDELGEYRIVAAFLRERVELLIWRLDKSSKPPPAKHPHRAALGTDDGYEATAFLAVLDTITLNATNIHDAVQGMRGASNYAHVIAQTSAALEAELGYAVSLFDAYDGKDKHLRFTTKIEAAGLALARLERFIDSRQNNKQLKDGFARSRRHANKLLVEVELKPLGSIETTTSNDQEVSATEELNEIASARSDVTSALTSLQIGITEGANQFYELAKLVNPPDDDDLFSELVKGLLIALIGNVVGPAASALASKFAGTMTKKVLEVTDNLVKHPHQTGKVVKQTVVSGKEVVDKLGDAGKNFVSGSGTDTSQAWAGTIVDQAGAKANDKTAQNKGALFFKTSLILAADDARAKIEAGISKRANDREVSAEELRATAAQLAKDATGAVERTRARAARDFALMLARDSLGADENPRAKTPDKKLTRIGNDYQFGEGWTDGRRNGAEGIARIRVFVSGSTYSVRHYEVVGLNHEMAKLVFEGAKGKIGDLGLPTEIELSSNGSLHKEMLVVDETRKIRFSTAWNMFQAPALQAIASQLDTPGKAWEKLRELSIPDSFTVKTSDK